MNGITLFSDRSGLRKLGENFHISLFIYFIYIQAQILYYYIYMLHLFMMYKLFRSKFYLYVTTSFSLLQVCCEYRFFFRSFRHFFPSFVIYKCGVGHTTLNFLLLLRVCDREKKNEIKKIVVRKKNDLKIYVNIEVKLSVCSYFLFCVLCFFFLVNKDNVKQIYL